MFYHFYAIVNTEIVSLNYYIGEPSIDQLKEDCSNYKYLSIDFDRIKTYGYYYIENCGDYEFCLELIETEKGLA